MINDWENNKAKGLAASAAYFMLMGLGAQPQEHFAIYTV